MRARLQRRRYTRPRELVVERYWAGPAPDELLRRARDGAARGGRRRPRRRRRRARLELARLGASCAAILVAHGHFDHLGGVADLAEGTGAPVYMPEGERDRARALSEFAPAGMPGRPYTPDHLLEGGETIEVAGLAFDCVAIPGHSPAHVAFYVDGHLFSGDLLFAGSVGRVDLPGADWDTLLDSVRDARRPLSARDDRLPRARAADDARRRARAQSLPRGAARVTRIEAPRGTHDVLPSDQPLWQKVTGEMERLCALYGYRRIQTPGFEDTELFQRTSGAGSDIVQKEMYTFEDRGGRSLTLRPEGTAPICRAYIEHGMHREPQPVKLYTIAPMYRYAAPQRGRYREHYQLSLESIGSADPAVDAEVIQYYDALLQQPRRRRVRAAAQLDRRPQLPPGVRREAERVARRARRRARRRREAEARDEPAPRLRREGRAGARGAQDAPKIGESLCAECEAALRAGARATSTRTASAYTIDPTLVRGLDYYTRTTFEFVGPDESAQASTICGGGRYDYLVEEIGGPPTPGIGFGAGIERLMLSLELEGITAEEPPLDLFLVLEAPEQRGELLRGMAELRARGISVDTDYAGRSVKGQLTQAQKRATGVAIRGADGWTLRRRGEQDRERPRRWKSCCEQLARHDLRRVARGRCRQARERRRLGGHASRPRRARVHRPARLLGQGAARHQPRARAGCRGGRARDPERVRAAGRGGGHAARAGRGEPEHPDRGDRDPGRHADDRLALGAAAVPDRRGERRRGAAPPVPLPRHAQRAHAAQPAPQPHGDQRDPP